MQTAPQPTTFSPAEPAPIPISLEQWAAMDEDEPGELVDGCLSEEESLSHLHTCVAAWLMFTLRAWAAPRKSLLFGSEHKIAVSKRRGRKPDITLYPPGLCLRTSDALSSSPPLLVVEVLSPTPRDVRRDRIEKTQDYASFGVCFYLLVDPMARTFELYELGPDLRYVQSVLAGDGQMLLPGFDGLVLNLDELWKEVDKTAYIIHIPLHFFLFTLPARQAIRMPINLHAIKRFPSTRRRAR